MIILLIVVGIVLLTLLFSKIILNSVFGKRCEPNPNLKYFTADDFEGLSKKAIQFKSNKGQTLKGNIYTHDSVKDYEGLIVFVHGMGGGHLSYTTEINTFAKAGFIVLAYDNTGTWDSEGKNLKGFFQSVIDLKNALKYINEDEKLSKYEITLVGHSWGAYSVCQVLQYHLNVKKVVAMSGFNSSAKVICDSMKEQIKKDFSFLKPFLMTINFLTFGKNANRNTVDILKNTDIPVLILHGDSDTSVIFENSLCNKKLEKKTNIEKIVYKDRLHNVYQTKESEKYLNDTFSGLSALKKQYKGKIPKEESEKIYNNIDYKKMTEEDEEVMNTIINFIKK